LTKARPREEKEPLAKKAPEVKKELKEEGWEDKELKRRGRGE
jgi:hypothetical protein